MEKYILKEDVRIICLKAKSFPLGVKDAFDKLAKMIPNIKSRVGYGVSYMDAQGAIIYKAGASEMFEGEAEKYGCESFILKKGAYLIETLHNWKGNEQMIGATFKKLLEDPELDIHFPCVEWYKAEDEVMCMVRIKQTQKTSA